MQPILVSLPPGLACWHWHLGFGICCASQAAEGSKGFGLTSHHRRDDLGGFSQQLAASIGVSSNAAGPHFLRPKEIMMSTALLNDLAFRFGGFGRGGGGFAFLLVFMVFVGVIVWALSRSAGSESQKS